MSEKIPEHKLEKIGENKYRLTTHFEHLKRVDEFDKEFLKQSYKGGVEEYNKVIEQLKTVNKKLKETEYTKEEEQAVLEFIELNNKASKYNDYKKAVEQRDVALDMLERLRMQKEDIERVCPELKRAKK